MSTYAKRFLHLVMILALYNMLASPACAFVSGEKASWEVCGDPTRDQVVSITLDPSVTRLIVDSTKPSKEPHQSKKNECSFCFSNMHLEKSSLKFTTLDAPTALYTEHAFFLETSQRTTFTKRATNQTRAPPVVS